MNIETLSNELIKLEIPVDAYSLTGGLPNESFCIGFAHNMWEVYYSERGGKTDLKKFEKESEACEYFLSIIKQQFC